MIIMKAGKLFKRSERYIKKSIIPCFFLSLSFFLYSIKLPGDIIVDRVDKVKEKTFVIHAKQLNNEVNGIEGFVSDFFSKINRNYLKQKNKDICNKYFNKDFFARTYLYQELNFKSYGNFLIVGKDTIKTLQYNPNYISRSISLLYPLNKNLEALEIKEELKKAINLLPDTTYFNKRDSILYSVGLDAIKNEKYQIKKKVIFSQLTQLKETLKKAINDSAFIEIDSSKYLLPEGFNELYLNYPKAQGNYKNLKKISLECLCNPK